ncbi:MAG TPA: NAD-dependent epimerase/dehydratase family protein [Anaerolineales bacterium]|nr:NAD-dependent epimerase/dehydratase family protein [Anaerolineales bacterium]
MKVFLTGGTGFIGQLLTKALLARGWSVVALVRNPDSSQAGALAKMGAQCVTGDITERESMRAGMTGADIVIHNAAWYELGLTDSARKIMCTINVTGTDNVMSLALHLGVSRTVYVSSTVYYGDTGAEVRDETYRRQAPYRTFYERTKAEAHEVALRYQERDLPLITICPAHVVGPNDHSPYGYFQRLYVNRLLPPFSWAPDTIHSPVHVMEVAEGIALAAEKGRLGQTYILAGQSTSLRQVLEIWATQPGGFRVSFFVPFWLAALMFAPMEPVQRWLGLPAFISRETVSSNKSSLSFSSAKAQRELGWTHRPAREMWSSILDQEHELLAARRKRDLVTRLKPIETSE